MVVPGNYASSAGLDFTRALALEEPPTACQQVVAVRACDEDRPWTQDLKESLPLALLQGAPAEGACRLHLTRRALNPSLADRL